MCRGFKDRQVLAAFAAVDREDFVPPECKKYAYIDMDIPISPSGIFALRLHYLAGIVSRIIGMKPENLLVVGDLSGYTTAVLKHIYGESCVSVTEKEFLGGYGQKFDVIYFDSKIYAYSILRRMKTLLRETGKAIYMVNSNPEPFSLRKAVWKQIDVLEKSYGEAISTLFSWNIFLRER